MHHARWLVPSTALLYAMACTGSIAPGESSGHAEADADVVATPSDAGSAVPWELDVADYDQSCQYNSECRPVPPGPCADCMCYDAALNQRDAPRYMDAFTAEYARTRCQSLSHPPPDSCADTCDGSAVGICVNGACAVGPRRWLDSAAYDRACATPADCVGVNIDLCSVTSFCSGVIAVRAKSQFDADRAAAPVCGTPAPAQPRECDVNCVDGTCALVFHEVP